MSEQRSDHGAELALLAACLESKTARQEARRHITGRDLDDPRHEAIWEAMGRLDRHNKSVDAVTLNAILAGDHAAPLLRELVTTVGLPDSIPEYASIIRGWSTKRQVEAAARKVVQEAMNPHLSATGFAASVVNRFTAIRDSGSSSEDLTALTMGELLEQEDDEPEWVIPGFLEKRDRFMLTGEEGLGKSHLLRQFAVLAAAGLDPLTMDPIPPVRSAIIDCENSWAQVRRKLRPVREFAMKYGSVDPANNVLVECSSRMDITRDKDLARIHQILDVQQPDIVVIGPLYRLIPRALQTDDEATPVLAALDTLRERGCALLMEAHAGHAIGKGGIRDLRPRGSSALLGWPEFGFGMRGIGAEGYADLVQWRGPREERDWPQRLRKADGLRWIPHHDLYGFNQGGVA